MKHTVRTIANRKVVFEKDFATAEEAYKEYTSIIADIKSFIKDMPNGFERTVARYNDEMLMTYETIKR